MTYEDFLTRPKDVVRQLNDMLTVVLGGMVIAEKYGYPEIDEQLRGLLCELAKRSNCVSAWIMDTNLDLDHEVHDDD